jgi:hypothetical protein
MMALTLAARATHNSGRHFVEYFLFEFFLCSLEDVFVFFDELAIVGVFNFIPWLSGPFWLFCFFLI